MRPKFRLLYINLDIIYIICVFVTLVKYLTLWCVAVKLIRISNFIFTNELLIAYNFLMSISIFVHVNIFQWHKAFVFVNPGC